MPRPYVDCNTCQHRWLCRDRVDALRPTVCEINADTTELERRDAALLDYIASGRHGRSYTEVREHFGWNNYQLMFSSTYLRKTGQITAMGRAGHGPRFGTPYQSERAQWVYRQKYNFERWLKRRKRNGTKNIHD